MNVDSIKNGVVIDHIKAGQAMKLYNLLELDTLECTIAIIKNVPSKKMGKKDIIKIDTKMDVDLDIIGYVDPEITVNVIEKCLEMTGTLLKAHEEVRDLCLAGNSDAALQVLNGCQALAISLGTQMEKNMPGSEALVHMLEDYCEKVYVASTSWDENSAGSLSTSIGNVETEIEKYFSTKKKEVLFLPTTDLHI